MKKKIRIVSADFNNSNPKNELYIPKQDSSNFNIETFIYTDQNYFSRNNSLHPRLKGKIPKMLDWMMYDADYYIWVDSYYDICSSNIEELVSYVENYPICLNKHYLRSSITDEVAFIINEIGRNNSYLINRYEGEPLKQQLDEYLKDTSFIDNKLYALGFFIYRKDFVENYSIMKDWFFHNCYWSIQDQISFPYLLHKYNIVPNVFDFEGIYNNPYAKYNR